MDIRIGNDIRIDASITDYVESDQYCIKRINCVLVNTDNTNDDCHEAFPQSYTPTQYNMHVCGNVAYNAIPSSEEACDCGYTQPLLADNSPHKLTFEIEDTYEEELKNHYWYEPHTKFDKDTSLLLVFFPGKHQHICGTYKLMVFVVLYDTSWEDPHIHTVVLKVDDVFKLIHDDSMEAKRIILTCNLVLNDIEKYNISLNGEDGDKGDKGDKGDDGENAYQVLILTDYGNILLLEDTEVTLTAEVWNGEDCITDQIPSSYFSWIRISKNTYEDNDWNINHKNVGCSIVVPKSTIDKKAQYQCNFDLESYLYFKNN